LSQQIQLGFDLVKVHGRWFLRLLTRSLLRLLVLLLWLLILLLLLLLLLQCSQEKRVDVSAWRNGLEGLRKRLLEGELEGEWRG
jgi:hypothetical protein